MDRLSGLDASFLYLETPEQLMHVSGLLLLEPGTMPRPYRFEDLRDAIARRVRDVPMFTRKIRRVPLDLDHPIWVEDRHFDIDRHVHRHVLPAPGGDAELTELIGHLAGQGLHRSHPLWEMHVVEGLASGQVAVVAKMHHASVDGVNGANAISFFCSLEPEAPLLELPPSWQPISRLPSRAELFARGVAESARKPFQLAGLVRPTAGILAEASERARRGMAMAAPLTAPRTSFNGSITGQRSVAIVDLPLDRVRALRKAVPGVTVNDVVLTLGGGALRRYLEDRGELPETSLLATVPVSVHGETSHEVGRNKVSSMFARLGTDVADPVERLHRLAVSNAHAKDHHQAIPADTLQDWAKFAGPRVFGTAMRAVSALRLAEHGPVIHNLVISNVPGPQMPLYFLGARVDGLYPLGPVFHGAGLNVSVMSLDGALHIGIIACRESVPEPWRLARDFPLELDALSAALL